MRLLTRFLIQKVKMKRLFVWCDESFKSMYIRCYAKYLLYGITSVTTSSSTNATTTMRFICHYLKYHILLHCSVYSVCHFPYNRSFMVMVAFSMLYIFCVVYTFKKFNLYLFPKIAIGMLSSSITFIILLRESYMKK